MNINLFLSKDQLLSETVTESHSGEICYVKKIVVQTLQQYFWRNSLRSLRFCYKNELLHTFLFASQLLKFQWLVVARCFEEHFHLADIPIKIIMIINSKVIDPF